METPKWSFVKYKYKNGAMLKELVSPLPNIFNYGFIPDTVSEDGDPRDVLILGKRLPQGTHLDVSILGYVKFYDEDKKDFKYISSLSQTISWFDLLKIRLFFKSYALFKTIHSIVIKRTHNNFRYEGIILNNLK